MLPEKFARRGFVRVRHAVNPVDRAIVRVWRTSLVSYAFAKRLKVSPLPKSIFNARDVVGLELSKAELQLQANAERDLVLRSQCGSDDSR